MLGTVVYVRLVSAPYNAMAGRVEIISGMVLAGNLVYLAGTMEIRAARQMIYALKLVP